MLLSDDADAGVGGMEREQVLKLAGANYLALSAVRADLVVSRSKVPIG